MSVRPWLPENAFSGALVGQVLSDSVARWAQSWIVTGTAAISKVWAVSTGSGPVTSACLQIGGAHAALSMSEDGKRRLLEAALDVALSERERSECDNQVLDAFAKEVGLDLVGRVDAILTNQIDVDTATQVGVAVSIDDKEILKIVVPDYLLVPALKAQLGGARRSDVPPGRRTEALRRTPLVARAVLGCADLSLSEVKELGKGDILILDRNLEEPVELRVTTDGPPVARGVIRRHGDKISIQL